MINSSTIKNMAYEAGFDLCGIVSPDVIPEAKTHLDNWLKQDFQGEMNYMSKEPERRSNPRRLMPEVNSIIMLGINYYQPDSENVPPNNGRVSKYARGKDYHNVIGKKTKALIKAIKAKLTDLTDDDFRWYVDYAPILERAYAAKAGLGYIGKNSMLINKYFGSWIFLSEILTSLELEPDNPYGVDHGACGRCRMCIVSCPTSAIIENGVIDARKCISYLTVERPSDIPEPLARRMNDKILGCDICQDVCPKNKKSRTTAHQEFLRGGVGEFVNALELLKINDREDFLDFAAGTPLTRPKLAGMKRNAEIVLKNLKRRHKGDCAPD
ncbi:MAG: tRNA epoxyqueuosine(34) reductase QueG [Candidatus Zixiibacteriota bacterium]